jgi:tRNA-splicing ligase RtcB
MGMSEGSARQLKKAGEAKYIIPRSFKPGMKLEGVIYATERMLGQITSDNALEQVANVTFLPGLQKYSMAMPDIHWGYGFPIGGVGAFDYETGVVSPGGIGYDINCGVRLLTTHMTEEEVRPKIVALVNQLFRDIPSGVGSEGRIRVSGDELDKVVTQGGRWAVEQGYGVPEDLEHTEENGTYPGADPSVVSDRAKKRGRPQLGTLGAGNHFLEVQVVDQVYDETAARTFGITEPGQVTIMIHTGSRGFGYQVCDDYLVVMQQAARKYGIELPDRQLACAPIRSPEGERYLAAMKCAANYAWANRQSIAHWVREAFERIFGTPWRTLGIRQVYDVAHNIAKIEDHAGDDGAVKKMLVHRKGATRAFPAGHAAVPGAYRSVGQPVLVPGDMGTCSFLMVGTQQAMEETFGSTCHGAGRLMSRKKAIEAGRQVDFVKRLGDAGIVVRAQGRDTLAEEAPEAYKNVQEVADAAHLAGISRRVARMRPIGVVKG